MSSLCMRVPRMSASMRHAVLYVTSRSRSMTFAEIPHFAFENTSMAWNHSESGTFDFSKIVPAAGAIWNEQREQWYFLRPFIRLNTPPHAQCLP